MCGYVFCTFDNYRSNEKMQTHTMHRSASQHQQTSVSNKSLLLYKRKHSTCLLSIPWFLWTVTNNIKHECMISNLLMLLKSKFKNDWKQTKIYRFKLHIKIAKLANNQENISNMRTTFLIVEHYSQTSWIRRFSNLAIQYLWLCS